MPTLKVGYAFTSTRRSPILPDTVVVGEEETGRAKYVGIAYIEGDEYNTFRDGRRFYFQLKHMSYATTKGARS